MLKRIASYVLVFLVITFTVLGLLAIWDVIAIEDVMRKILLSLFVVFVASVVVLFIFSVVIREDSSHKKS